MTLYIKNMVCDRCKAAVKAQLEKNQIHYKSVDLGEVETEGSVPDQKLENFRNNILPLGFELIDDKRSLIIERIKAELITIIRNSDASKKFNFSTHLAQQIGKDYSTLSSLFSEVEGVTIEHYFINQKIERAKELIAYDQLSLKEIAHQLNYSSVSHLSNQFKKITGLTPGHFKDTRNKMRKSLDKI
jgi:AraC-like DNA-binding protein